MDLFKVLTIACCWVFVQSNSTLQLNTENGADNWDVLDNYIPCCHPNIMYERRCQNETNPEFKCPLGRYVINQAEIEIITNTMNKKEINAVYTEENFCLTKLMINESYYELLGLKCFPEHSRTYSRSIEFSRVLTCIVSIIFATLTLITYFIVPDLRDLQGKCIMCFLSCMIFGFTILTIMQTDNHISRSSMNNISCQIQAYSLYFWMMCQFFWLNVIAVNVWRQVRFPDATLTDKKMFIIYNTYAWGMTSLLMLCAFIADHIPDNQIRPNFGVWTCWFSGTMESWTFFHGPLSILLTINLILFILTAVHLWINNKRPNPSNRIISHRYKFLLYLKLIVVMGITWLCEPISFFVDSVKENSDEEFLIIQIMDYVNMLQGILIFFILILTRKRALRGLANAKVFGFRLVPASCATQQRLGEDLDEILDDNNDLEQTMSEFPPEIKN